MSGIAQAQTQTQAPAKASASKTTPDKATLPIDIAQVNTLVREASPRHTKMALARQIKRRQVYAISKDHADHDLAEKRANMHLGIINEEPWPFSDPDFGLVTTADGSQTRYPFRNPSGFNIGTPEAYCANMIYDCTGHWLRPIDHRPYPDIWHYKIARHLWVDSKHTFDARNWVSFLALNHFTTHSKSPQTGYHYVGIDQHDGETGLVVWFHRRDSGDQATVSTRLDREFHVYQVSIFDFTWVKIL